MKKPLFALALALTFVLILPLTVSASSVFWDADSITKIIQPLVGMRDYVAKFASFTATSTTATSSIAGPLQLTSLPSKTCLGTDVNGLIQTGTCGGGEVPST